MRDTVYLLVFDGFADHQAALAMTEVRRPGDYRVVCAGIDMRPVTTASGLDVCPQRTLRDIDPDRAALVVAPGGHAWEHELAAYAAVLRRLHAAGVPLAGVDSAVLGLARAGLLQGRRHTGPSPDYLSLFAPDYGDERYDAEAGAVTDGGVITACGFAGVDLAFEVIRLLGLYDGADSEQWYRLFRHGVPAWSSDRTVTPRERAA